MSNSLKDAVPAEVSAAALAFSAVLDKYKFPVISINNIEVIAIFVVFFIFLVLINYYICLKSKLDFKVVVISTLTFCVWFLAINYDRIKDILFEIFFLDTSEDIILIAISALAILLPLTSVAIFKEKGTSS